MSLLEKLNIFLSQLLLVPYIYGKTLIGKWGSTLVGFPILAVIIAWTVSLSNGTNEHDYSTDQECHSENIIACLLMTIITVVSWITLLTCTEPIFRLFGANDEVMSKILEYGQLIIWFFPVFVFTIFIPAFIRNDGAPKFAMAAVLAGGCTNICRL